MARKFQYVPIDRILSKIYRDLGLEEVSETDVIEWTAEALEAIGVISIYEEAIAFAEVKNHQTDVPCGLHSIIQIARDNEMTCGTEVKAVYNEFIGVIPPQEDKTGIYDCSTLLLPLEQDYYRPYYDLKYEYEGWSNHTIHRRYTPVRLSNHTFFNTVVLPEDPAIYNSTVFDEYSIVHDKLRFSFKEGVVAIAYHRPMIDQKTGYPLVPDDFAVITAITMYITMKYMGRLWYMGREGYADKFQKAEVDWHWYCKQAGNALMAPYGEDDFQNILEGRKQMIPRHNKYYGYFGNLGKNSDYGWTRGSLTGITNRR